MRIESAIQTNGSRIGGDSLTPSRGDGRRLAGLRRFAIAITILTLLGHTVLGFEQSWIQPLVALVTAYGMEFLLELIDARLNARKPRFIGNWRTAIDFFLSPHISGLAVAMLLYANDRLWVIAFATAAAIGSKAIFRVSASGSSKRHFLNPSNFGITITLLLFPWVGIVPPYHFTENNFNGIVDWILPFIIIFTGSLLNGKLTKRIPLIAAWVAGFLVQGVIRSWHGDPRIDDTTMFAALTPMSGVAFVLFTFYMITDPATTPSKPLRQVVFGASVALVYGLLVTSHIVFTMFFALTIVCTMRGFGLFLRACFARYRASLAIPVRELAMPLPQPIRTGLR